MEQIKAQTIRGTLPKDGIFTFDTNPLKSHFPTEDLRGMSTSAIVTRSLVRQLTPTAPPGPCGIYLIATPPSWHERALKSYLQNPAEDDSESLALFPPKMTLTGTAPMTAAWMAMEAKATGPIVCLLPTAGAWALLQTEIEYAFENSDIRSCFVGACFSFADPFFAATVNGSVREMAHIAYLERFSSAAMIEVGKALSQICQEAGIDYDITKL